MAEFPFKATESAEPAQWLVERLTTFGKNVLSIVPSGFEAYARIFHPAQKVTNTSDDWENWSRTALSWADVAALTGRTAHRTMQWPSIRGDSPDINDYPPAQVGESWVESPEEGKLPLELARSLWPLLEHHTQTPEECFFAIWEGFGGLPRIVHEAPSFEIPGRRFHLFEGAIHEIEQNFYTGSTYDDPGRTVGVGIMFEIPDKTTAWPTAEEIEELIENAPPLELDVHYQSANLWWPEGRAWCVATEIDFNTTYVAGTQALVDDLLAREGLEVYQVEPADAISYAADTVNPEPRDPYAKDLRLE